MLSHELTQACKAKVTFAFQSLAFRAHCDVLVCLSNALEPSKSGAPREITVVSNCHGVRSDFLAIGRQQQQQEHQELQLRQQQQQQQQPTEWIVGPFYFLAKKVLSMF
jgi:hypothetical protein